MESCCAITGKITLNPNIANVMNLNLFPKAGLWSGFSPKVLLVMKLTVFLTIITLTQVSETVYSQRITLEASNPQRETLREKIKATSGYDMFTEDEDIRKAVETKI